MSHASKEVTACPELEHVTVNTENIIHKDVSTETVKPVVSKETMASFADFAATHATQTTVSFSHLAYDEKMCNDVATMTEPDYHVPLRIEQIQDNNDAVRFHTGFPTFKILMACFLFLGESASKLSYGAYEGTGKTRRSHILSPINEFFLMLCRMRLGLLEQDLAYRFGISQSTVSRVITTWINFCYSKFKEVPIWPSREVVDNNMPQIFRNLYPSTRCIIDATEIFIEKPKNPTAQQLTFSKYKNHNTFKALIAISPAGAISFVSDLYGGNISDKQLTAVSGLLDLLEEGDSVMADRGFTISDLLKVKNVTLNVPPRVEDPSGQLSEHDRVETRRIASVRVHVERAIGRIKNYHILHAIPNSMYMTANQLFFVCAFLTNFQSSLIE